jgi:hypothetical protein
MSDLVRLSWSERRKLTKALRSAGMTTDTPSTDQSAAGDCMRTFLRLTEQVRHEWVYWYALGDYCRGLGFCDTALSAYCCCYHLRPEDPRSTYALATAFRRMSQADPLKNSGAGEAAPTSLGFGAEESAAAAIHYFAKTLNYVKGKDARSVRRSIDALAKEFPALKGAANLGLLAAPLQYVQQHGP